MQRKLLIVGGRAVVDWLWAGARSNRTSCKRDPLYPGYIYLFHIQIDVKVVIIVFYQTYKPEVLNAFIFADRCIYFIFL